MAGERAQTELVRLDGLHILLVEDEFYIADEVQQLLESAGATVIGPHATVANAVAAADEGRADFAVIDLNLHGESAAPIADRLQANGVPFAISTGYGSESVPEHLKSAPRIEKPFDLQALLQLVAQLGSAKLNSPEPG